MKNYYFKFFFLLLIIIGCNNFKSINWFEGNLEDACATTDGKIIMIDFYTDW